MDIQKKLKVKNNNRPSKQVQDHRKYTKLSQFAPDENFIINYLSQRNFTQTIIAFKTDLSNFYSKNHIKTPNKTLMNLLQFLNNDINDVSITAILAEFKKFLENMKETEMVLKIELLFYIWLSTSQIDQSGHAELKKFIQQKGNKLSENQQLLKYFVLPYLSKRDIKQHPILKQIYSNKWKQQLIQLIKQLQQSNNKYQQSEKCLSVKPLEQIFFKSQNLEWFELYKDVIKISKKLIKYIPQKIQKVSQVNQLISDLLKYEKVLKNHNSINSSITPSIQCEIKQQQFKHDFSKKNISSLDGSSQCVDQLQQLLKKQFDSKGQLKNFGFDNLMIQPQLQLFKIQQLIQLNLEALVHTIQNETLKLSKKKNQQTKLINLFWSLTKILSFSKLPIRQELISQLIQADIFVLKKNENKQLHWILVILGSQKPQLINSFLQFFNKLCQFYYIRQYLVINFQKGSRDVLRSINSLFVYSLEEEDEQMNRTILSIYYKLSTRAKLCCCLETFGIVKYLQKNIEKLIHSKSYESYVLLYSVALLVHILLKTSFFERLDQMAIGKRFINLLIIGLQSFGQYINNAKFASLSQFQQVQNLQEFSNAAIYAFVRIPQYRSLPEIQKVKQIILNNIVSRNEQPYTRQATYILQKIDSLEPQTIYDEIDNDEEDSDQGEQEVEDKNQFYSHLVENRLKILKILEQFKFTNVPKVMKSVQNENLILQFKSQIISHTPIKNSSEISRRSQQKPSSKKKSNQISASDRTPEKNRKSGKKQKYPQQQYVKDKYNWKKQVQIKMSYISA